jgi:hypothetical protein
MRLWVRVDQIARNVAQKVENGASDNPFQDMNWTDTTGEAIPISIWLFQLRVRNRAQPVWTDGRTDGSHIRFTPAADDK